MKKIFTFLFILVSFTSFSQVLITDPFNYTPDAVNGLATQSSGVWSNVNTGDSILVASGNLSYSGLAASTGNKITYGGRGTDYYRGFTSQTSGTVYCSFLLNVTSIGTLNSVGSYTVAFIDGGSTNFASTVWLRLSGASGYNIGINPRTTAANSVWLPNTLSINTTYLIVIALQTVSGTANDISKIWVNPVSLGGTEPTPDATATNAGTDLSSIQRVLLRQHSDTTTPASLEIDEMRLGLTWADVTPTGTVSGPTLTASALNSFGDVCINTIPNPNTFTLSGSNLTAGDITVGPLSGFSFDTTLAGTYYNSLAIAQSGGTLAPKNIYVKFTPTAVQSYSGSIPVSGGGATANVPAVGSGVSATSVSSGTASSITTTGATVSGTLILACSAVTGYGIEYSTTSGFTHGTGIVISSSNLSGSGFTSTVNGLNPSTTYYYVAYVSTASDTSYGTQKSFNTSTPQSPNVLAGWNFFGQASPIKFAATTFNANLSKGGIDSLDNITRGDSASSSAGGNSFRTTGFKNNLISTSNKDYFQTTLKSTTGYTLSLDTINAKFAGTNTYYASPGVISQFAYGFDTTNFTLIGIPDTLTSTKLSSTVSLLGIPSLHNISSNSTVYIRYYASGQTSTGGWGFNSPDASINGLEFLGAVLPVSSPTPILSATTLTSFGSNCVNSTVGPNTFTISGSNLTTASITVGPLTGFSFDTTLAGTYYNSLTINQSGGTLAPKTIYVKFMPTAVQSYDGNISVSGAGATAINVAAVGSGASATTVSSGTASSITTTGATLSGTLTQGCSVATSYGIQYSITSGFTPGTGTDVASTNLSGTGFTSSLSGLTASTTYYYVAYAVTGNGTIYGTQMSFTTSASIPTTSPIAAWNFFGQSSPATFTATTFNLNLVATGGLKDITRGATAPSSTASNSFRTTGFKNDGISISNTDYFQTTLQPAVGYNMSISSINTRFNGTATFNASPGVTSQFAYSLDNTTYTLIGSPSTSTSFKLSVDLSSVSALQNIGNGTTVYIRYYASGQTTTGGWGFASPTIADTSNGLEFMGVLSLASISPTLSSSSLPTFGNVCVSSMPNPNTFTVSGTNLNAGDITVGPLAGYTFSTSAGGSYSNTLTITQAGGTLASTTVFVMFMPSAVQSYNGNISLSGAGATTINVAATGSGVGATAIASGNASGVSSTVAMISGTLTQGCSVATSYGIQYSTLNGFTPGTGTNVSSTNLSGNNFSSSLSGLTVSTTYYYVAYAITGGGTIYGSQMSFTTTAIPVVPTLSATAFQGFGNVCLGNSAGPYSFDITGVNLTATSVTVGPLAGYSFATSSAGTYSSSLTITQSGGTLVATTVYVMFAPTAVQSYSGNISISGAGAAAIDVVTTGNGTLSSLSVISADSISVSSNVEIIKGKIDDAGCSPVVSYGIEYSSFQNFVLGTGIKVASTNLNTNDSTFSSMLTGLIQNTAYYYRAYVSNNASTVYGEQKLFITSAIPTGLTIYSNPLIRGRSVHYTLSGINLTDHYLVRIYDISGRLVFSKPLYYQLGVNFIDDNFVLPSTLSCGVYSFQVVSPEFRIQKMVIIADYTGPFGWRPF